MITLISTNMFHYARAEPREKKIKICWHFPRGTRVAPRRVMSERVLKVARAAADAEEVGASLQYQ